MRLELQNLSKSYGELQVLSRVSMTLESGRIYCLMGPSGTGKTTLFRLILGLERPDSGSVTGLDGRRLSAVFQEDRLCEDFSPVDNVALAADRRLTRQQIRAELIRLLPEESLDRPVSTFSGGMKRRVAIIRALLAPWDLLLMDEPFTGLDEDTRRLVISYVLEKADGRLVLVSTHQEEDVALLSGKLISL